MIVPIPFSSRVNRGIDQFKFSLADVSATLNMKSKKRYLKKNVILGLSADKAGLTGNLMIVFQT